MQFLSKSAVREVLVRRLGFSSSALEGLVSSCAHELDQRDWDAEWLLDQLTAHGIVEETGIWKHICQDLCSNHGLGRIAASAVTDPQRRLDGSTSEISEIAGAVQDASSEPQQPTVESRTRKGAAGTAGRVGLRRFVSAETLPPVSLSRVSPLEHPKAAASSQLWKEQACLPISGFRDSLVEMVSNSQVSIVVGDTGSGKTTQLPQFLLDSGKFAGVVGCTQPRRVAAMTVARRVAEERGSVAGRSVGYTVRFEDWTSPTTVIKFMTDGILLREFLQDPELKSYGVIIIDEAHERSLSTDIVLGLLKELLKVRQDLRIVVASATIDAAKFQAFFGVDVVPVMHIPGRRFPVSIKYAAEPENDYVHAAVATCLQIHLSQPPVDPERGVMGDILVFLTGQEEIEDAVSLLREKSGRLGAAMSEMLLCPLYSALSPEQQAQAFRAAPPRCRKIVLATNIAETSLTIENITYVIDCGFSKQNFFDASSHMESLKVTPISKANALQRAGRAGRTRPGICFRLYTAYSYRHELAESIVPEILRANLASVVLLLKSLGVDDVLRFPFLDAPPTESLVGALTHLYVLGALDHDGQLTRLGLLMSQFPLDPPLSKMIVASAIAASDGDDDDGCSEEMVSLASMLSVGLTNLFVRPRGKEQQAEAAKQRLVRRSPEGGDFLLLIEAFRQYLAAESSRDQCCQEYFLQTRSMRKADEIRRQLLGVLTRLGLARRTSADPVAVRRAVCQGLFMQHAWLDKSGSYASKAISGLQMHPSCILRNDPPKHVIFYELAVTTRRFMRCVCAVDPAWVHSAAPPRWYSPPATAASGML